MPFSNRIVSKSDHERLVAAAGRARASWVTYAPYLDLFRTELRRADVVPPGEVPDDVVTMNSRFALSHRHSGETVNCTLVYPGGEDARAGKISVLSPMGHALLGARVGEEVCWLTPDGPEVATVRRLHYQPEAASRHSH